MQPNLLIGKKFCIPVFMAQHQKYICNNVDVEYPGNGKTYKISFSEIVEHGYNVPDKLELVIGIPLKYPDDISLRLYEIKDGGREYELYRLELKTKQINSIKGFSNALIEMGNRQSKSV